MQHIKRNQHGIVLYEELTLLVYIYDGGFRALQ